jgi:hypothetical protein
MEEQIFWPEPRSDPPEEPAEPWARPGAPTWQELLRRLKEALGGADPEGDR